jgi:hypothetical protein
MITLDAAFDSALARLEADGYASLSAIERLLVAIWWLEADVNNGGFEQYYFNSGGDFATMAPSALREIGAHEMARIVDEANAHFGPVGPSTSRDDRQVALERIRDAHPDAFELLNARFWTYPDDLAALLATSLGINANA